MSTTSSARIHPTAVISPEAQLAEDVQVGAYAIIEGTVRLGPGCIIRPHAHLIGPLSLGSNNIVHSGAVLGDLPQHLRFDRTQITSVEIGDDNIFRENVTVHRAALPGGITRIGNRNFFMAGSHVAHDCVVGDGCVLVNNALLGGHVVLENNVFISGNSAVHQFVRMGRLSFLSGTSGTSKDVPPFIMQQTINRVVGVNVVGMRRAGMSSVDVEAVRHAFHVLYRQSQPISLSLLQLEQELGHNPAVAEMLAFIHNSRRGINLCVDHEERGEAA